MEPSVHVEVSPESLGRFAQAALEYATLGWRVYPVERGGKRPLYGDWINDATTEPDLIRRWWRSDEWAPNVGVIMGEQVDVVDVEAAHVAAFNQAARVHGLPPNPMACSGGGGLHVYVAPLGLGTRRLVLDGIHIGELKGSGGVLAPPSVTTGDYRWLRSPAEVAVAAAPDWLVALCHLPAPIPAGVAPGMLSPARAVALVAGLYRLVAQAREGERNRLLFWAACRVAEHGVDRDAASEILLAAALAAGLHDREARATIASGLAR